MVQKNGFHCCRVPLVLSSFVYCLAYGFLILSRFSHGFLISACGEVIFAPEWWYHASRWTRSHEVGHSSRDLAGLPDPRGKPHSCHVVLNVHWMFTECSLNVHWLFTECSLHVHWLFTECSLNVHWTFTERSPNIHWMSTKFPLNVHWMFTEYPLNAHKMSSEYYAQPLRVSHVV
jgi:hypothetical protein